MSRYMLSLCTFLCSSPVLATGLSYWESSATNTALAAANGAIALDASVLALAPSSITQLNDKNISGTVTQYRVTSDFEILGQHSHYKKENPIPSFFISSPIRQHLYAGLGIYSRTAADISVPEVGPHFLPFFYETHVTPIVVSVAPTVAYRWGDLSLAMSVEYLHLDYELTQYRRRFGNDHIFNVKGEDSGWSGALSATWQPCTAVSVAVKHQYGSELENGDMALTLPTQTDVYLTWQPTASWLVNASYSRTEWQGRGMRYHDYADPFGLLIGTQDSERFAISARYQWDQWSLMAGYSADDAVDRQGGKDQRYRVGLGYKLNKQWTITAAWLQEQYADKAYQGAATNLVSVQNSGSALSLGVSYHIGS